MAVAIHIRGIFKRQQVNALMTGCWMAQNWTASQLHWSETLKKLARFLLEKVKSHWEPLAAHRSRMVYQARVERRLFW